MNQIFIQGGRVFVADVPDAGLEPGRVRVDVHYSAISPGTEGSLVAESGRSFLARALQRRHRWNRLWEAARRRDLADLRTRFDRLSSEGARWIAPGYSAAGIVRAVGAGVHDVSPGDRVAVCGAGYAAHAESITAPRGLVVPVPPALPLAPAATVALGAIALQAVRRADSRLGESVCVLGLGLLGQLTVALLRAAGCRVLAWDPIPSRRELAERAGAEILRAEDTEEIPRAALALTDGTGADQVILAGAGGPALPQAGAEATRCRGTLVFLGLTPLAVDRETAYARELDLRISTSYGPGRYDPGYEEEGRDYPLAHVRWTARRNAAAWLALLTRGAVSLDGLFRVLEGPEEAAEAYVALRAGSTPTPGLIVRYAAAGTAADAPLVSTAVDAADRDPARSATGATAPPRPPLTPPVRVALLGTGGYAAEGILPHLAALAPRFRPELLAGSVPARREPLARSHGFARTTGDYATAAEDPNTDLIVIATRHDSHGELARRALRAGKAVFCEKPLALRSEELDAIEEALRGGGLLVVGFNRRFAPAVVRLREELVRRRSPLQISYRVQAGPLPETHWIRGPQGGGRLVGEAVHMVDLLGFLAGSEVARAWILPGGGGPDPAADNFHLGLRYADGSSATLLYTSRGSARHPKERLEVHADGESWQIDDFRALHRSGRATPLWQAPRADKGQAGLWRAVASALLDGGPSPTAESEILRTSRLVLDFEALRERGDPAQAGR